MRGTSLLLLCLLWSLVEVHSETESPYVSFMGETLPNHAYVNLNLVGMILVMVYNVTLTYPPAVHKSGVNLMETAWIPPGREYKLPFANDASADIYEVRGYQRVDMRRRNNADMPSGIYRCDIPTNAVHDDNDNSVRESAYVGLYASGGMLFMSCCVWYRSAL